LVVKVAEIYAPNPFGASGLDAHKRRLMLAAALQKQASTDDKVYTNAHGGMKLAAGLLAARSAAFRAAAWSFRKTASHLDNTA
jgi:hypothetical protein